MGRHHPGFRGLPPGRQSLSTGVPIMLPEIKGFLPSSLLDWDGKLASILFLPGCNFRCGYCHAGALIGRPNELETIPHERIREHIKENEGWIDGAVITGGEPTLHEGLAELCQWLREMSLGVKLDTNGSRPDVIADLIQRKLIDYVAMDIKGPLDARYSVITRTQCDVDAIRRSVEIIIGSGIDHEFRTTVCPAVLGRDGLLDAARALQGAKRLILQPFRSIDCLEPSFEGVHPLPLLELREWAQAARDFVPNCRVRGD